MYRTNMQDNWTGGGEQLLTHDPLPVRSGRKHRPPLEARTKWDPWLPAAEAYPEVSYPLRAFAFVVLALAVVLTLFVVFAQVAQ
jgi:hypothetical protein